MTFFNYLNGLAALFLLCAFSFSNAENSDISSEKITILRSSDDWGPNEFISESGELTGFHIDLIRLAADELDVEIEFISMPWKRALKTIEKGEADAISYTIFTPERLSYLIYKEGNAISEGSTRFAYLKGRDFDYDGTLESVKDRRIGVIRGYSYGEKFDRKLLTNLVNVNSEDQLVNMLLEKRVDLILVNIDHINYKYGHLLEFKNITSMEVASDRYDIYLAFSKKRQLNELAERFAPVIEKIRRSEKYQKIVQSYYAK